MLPAHVTHQGHLELEDHPTCFSMFFNWFLDSACQPWSQTLKLLQWFRYAWLCANMYGNKIRLAKRQHYTDSSKFETFLSQTLQSKSFLSRVENQIYFIVSALFYQCISSGGRETKSRPKSEWQGHECDGTWGTMAFSLGIFGTNAPWDAGEGWRWRGIGFKGRIDQLEVFPYISGFHLGWWISTTFWEGEKSSCYVQLIIQACKNEGLVLVGWKIPAPRTNLTKGLNYFRDFGTICFTGQQMTRPETETQEGWACASLKKSTYFPVSIKVMY